MAVAPFGPGLFRSFLWTPSTAKERKLHWYVTKISYVVLEIGMDGCKNILGVGIGEHESSKSCGQPERIPESSGIFRRQTANCRTLKFEGEAFIYAPSAF